MVLLLRAVFLGAFTFTHVATAITGGNLNAGGAPDDNLAGDILSNAYTVELNEGASVDDLSGQLESLGIFIKPRRILNSKLFNGVSFDIVESFAAGDWSQAGPLEEAIILSASAAKLIWPVRSVSISPDFDEGRHKQGGQKRSFSDDISISHRQAAVEEEPYVAHVMTQVDRAHDAGCTGNGVRIAILDTGIDETHPLLGGCIGGPDCILESRWDAFGVDVSDKEQFEAEFGTHDCREHGTHVAGVIGALPNKMGFRGVAPGARLSDYRVMSCVIVGTDEHIVAGMLRAFDDGNDILTMSLAFPTGPGESVLAATAARIVAAGVPVFASVGNEGEWDPMFSPGSPASGEMVSSVASYNPLWEPIVSLGASYRVDNDTATRAEFRWQPAASSFGFDGAEELAFPLLDLDRLVGKQYNTSNSTSNNTSNNTSKDTGCSSLPESIPDLSGFLIMVQYTTDSDCSLGDHQQLNIFARGGSNILFWERSADVLGDNTEIFEINDEINLGWVTSSTAKLLGDSLAAGDGHGHGTTTNVAITLNEDRSVSWEENKATGGQVSTFSSWGPNWDMRAAPSFGAPGHKILSTLPGGGVGVQSGTSFSTPLVAGAAAILIEATGSRDPEKLHNRLASTSRQVPLASGPYGQLEGIHPPTQAGAGIIQVLDAIQVKGILSMTSISFNDSDHHIDEVTIALENTGTKDAVYTLNYVAARTAYALGTDGYLDFAHWDSSASTASLTFSPEAGQVSAAAGQTVEIIIRCRAPEGVDQARWPVYSGYVTLNGTNGDNLVIPYVGNGGSMRDAVVISAETTNINWDPNEVKTIPRPPPPPPPARIQAARARALSASRDESRDGDWEPIPSPEEVYFSVGTLARLRTRELQVHLIPAAAGPEHLNETAHSNGAGSCHLPTHEWLGEETFGEVWGSPQINLWAGSLGAVDFAGMLANGKVVPEGHYRFMLSALRVFGDATSNKTEDWQMVTTDPFFLTYEISE